MLSEQELEQIRERLARWLEPELEVSQPRAVAYVNVAMAEGRMELVQQLPRDLARVLAEYDRLRANVRTVPEDVPEHWKGGESDLLETPKQRPSR